MSETFTHNCIKCSEQYTSDDPDPYYCSPCHEQSKAIAKEVDKKLAGRISKRTVKSDLQLYDEICRARGTRFAPIKDMGIDLKSL